MQTISFSVQDADALKICAAVGEAMNLGRAATGMEVKKYITDMIVNMVLGYDQRQAKTASLAAASIVAPATPITTL